MSDILKKILAVKAAEVAAAKAEKPLAILRAEAEAADPPRDFLAALRRRIDPQKKVGVGETANPADPLQIQQDKNEEQVLTALGHAPCTVDTLAARSGLTAEQLLAILLPLELGGRIAQLPGGLYQRLD